MSSDLRGPGSAAASEIVEESQAEQPISAPATIEGIRGNYRRFSLLVPNRRPLRLGQGLIIFGIFLIALLLRWYGLNMDSQQIPAKYEYHYVLAGLLLLDFEPLSSAKSSSSNAPKSVGPRLWMPAIHWNQRSYSHSSPFIHHPPLFIALAGALAKASGADFGVIKGKGGNAYFLNDINLGSLRYLSLFLFGVTFVLLFLVSNAAFSFPVAAVTMLIYGTSFPIIAHSRMLVPGNLITPLVLLSIWVVQNLAVGSAPRRYSYWILALCGAVAVLSETTSLALICGIAVLCLYTRAYRPALYLAVGAIFGLGLYIVWGLWHGGPDFWEYFADQFGISQGPLFLAGSLFSFSTLANETFDYIIFSAWIALLVFLFQRNKSPLFYIPLAWLFLAGFLEPLPADCEWRMLPLYPFLCMALAYLIFGIYRGQNPISFLGFLVLLLPYVFDQFFSSNESHPVLIRRAYLAVAPLLLYLSFSATPLARKTVRLFIILITSEIILSQIWCSLWRI